MTSRHNPFSWLDDEAREPLHDAQWITAGVAQHSQHVHDYREHQYRLSLGDDVYRVLRGIAPVQPSDLSTAPAFRLIPPLPILDVIDIVTLPLTGKMRSLGE